MDTLIVDDFKTDKTAIKVLVLSDSHGDVNRVLETIEYHLAEIDCVLFLGDGAADIAEAADIFSEITFYAVTGNNDFPLPRSRSVTFPLERLLTILGVKIYMTHGHFARYSDVKNQVVSRASELGASIGLYGHLHIPEYGKHDDVVRINPGSLSYPRGGSHAGYLILDIAENNFNTLFYDADNHQKTAFIHE